MSDIALTAAMRSNLLSLQKTSALADRTQLRLSTGKKVNSALDNAASFFAAQGLTNRASDLGKLLDGMGQAIQTLKAADEGIQLITKLVEQAGAIANSARDAGFGTAEATALEADFDAVRTQIDQAVTDTGYRGVNLLNNISLTVDFNEDGSSSITVAAVTFDAAGLNIAAADFSTATGISDSIDDVNDALADLRAQARLFGNNLTTIQNRETFTKGIMNALTEGADKLTLADQNEEGANLLALQTRQQLGITALSLASQAQQAILSLF